MLKVAGGSTHLRRYLGGLDVREKTFKRALSTIKLMVAGYDKRGLVVSVYYHPEGEEETTADDLSGYENGEQGPILA